MHHSNRALNIRQAADLLGVHEQTVRKLARSGELPAFKVGRDWRFSQQALSQWVDLQHQRTARRSKVLIIDDEVKICEALAKMVQGFGASPRQATSGTAGLALIAVEPPDIVLLDLKMPQMDGVEFLRRLRQTEPSLPVVIVTGYPESALLNQAMEYAPIMMLAKPVSRTLLERTMHSVLGSQSDRRSVAEDRRSVAADRRSVAEGS